MGSTHGTVDIAPPELVGSQTIRRLTPQTSGSVGGGLPRKKLQNLVRGSMGHQQSARRSKELRRADSSGRRPRKPGFRCR